MIKYREEKDSMGMVLVPKDAYYGAQTQRAVENFPISGITLPFAFIHALALIKNCAAQVNIELGLLDSGPAEQRSGTPSRYPDVRTKRLIILCSSRVVIPTRTCRSASLIASRDTLTARRTR